MAAPVGPKKVHRYTVEFKIQAVRLSLHPEIQTQDVAHALDIHPFMLSKWKKDYREGRLKPATSAAGLSLPKVLRTPKRDVRQLEAKVAARTQVRSLERKLAALEVEHDLLKKAIRFNIERRRRSSSS
jgi:transposase